MKVAIIIFSVLLLVNNVVAQQSNDVSVGAGKGMMYGLAGLKLDYRVIENLYITAGVGRASSIGFQYLMHITSPA